MDIQFLDIEDFFKIEEKEEIIEARKQMNKIVKKSRKNIKQRRCYNCNKECDSFCNSHTTPAFCLKNISKNGKVCIFNSIIEMHAMETDKGVNNAGTFHLICRECDNTIFQEYENPDNYKNKPTIKMLAQIHMKNNLKFIDKRMLERDMYQQGIVQSKENNEDGLYENIFQKKTTVNELDMKEYQESFAYAKSRSLKPTDDAYFLNYYIKLPYVVPIAYQGLIALSYDLEGNIINNIYNHNEEYKIKNVNLCIFPLNNETVIMMFVEKKNNRYRQFFKQFRKLSLEKQLQIINNMVFLYTEDYFLSPYISKDNLKKLRILTKRNSELLIFPWVTREEIKDAAKKQFNLCENYDVPNLLSRNLCMEEIMK